MGGRIRALDAIAAEVADARAHLPPRVLADAGLTPAVLDALAATSRRARNARDAARDSRVVDPTIPAVTSWLVTRAPTRNAAARSAPTPTPG